MKFAWAREGSFSEICSMQISSPDSTSGPCYKTFLEEILISNKFKVWKKFVHMSKLAQKCENIAIFLQNYTAKRFIAFKMDYYCCFSWGEIWIFGRSSKNNFITSTTDKKNLQPTILPGLFQFLNWHLIIISEQKLRIPFISR